MGRSHDRGWTYAQEKFDPAEQALMLNSDRARDMEHVNINPCYHNTHTTKVLSDERIRSSTDLVQLEWDHDLYCLGFDHPITITGLSGILTGFLDNPPVCKVLIGAGILHDLKSRTWACASTNREGAKSNFC
ncbi:hypothetical protein RJ55_04310 [Drechmeria coniospora]|nr:hypothetical protein RJ55_04310 [Drechmeria coniospora]